MPPRRRSVFLIVLIAVLLLLHGIPWWVLVLAPHWSTPVTLTGSLLTAAVLIGFPLSMWRGHGRHHQDALAVAGDSWLGIVWVLFTWSVIGGLAGVGFALAGVPDPGRAAGLPRRCSSGPAD